VTWEPEPEGSWLAPWEALHDDGYQYWVSDKNWFVLFATGTTQPYQHELDERVCPMFRMYHEQL
jgi:hypothetical protein